MRITLSLAVVLLASAAAHAAPPPEALDVVLNADSRPYLLRLHVYVDGRPYVGPYNVYLRRWFDYLDRNGDGFLDKDEAGRAPSVQVFQEQFQVNLVRAVRDTPPVFRELDADGDGKVTPDEFVAYYKRSGLGPIQLTNGNQFGFGSSSAGEVIFRALDTNGDGKLSKAEIARAEEALRPFDLNDDEIITAQELASNVAAIGRGFQGGQTPPTTTSGPLVLLPSDDAGRLRAANEILTRYDKNRDGALSRDEIGLPAELFAKLDKDKNGTLNAEELAAWLATPADAVLVVRLGKLDADQPPAEALPGEPEKSVVKIEKKADGVLGLSLGDLRVQVQRGQTNPNTNNAPRIRQFYLQNFKAADKGNKGFLTEEDVKERQASLFASIFAVADRDADGKLTEKELTDYLDLVSTAPLSLTSLLVTEQGTGLFGLLDADGDGRLSIRELRNAAARLAELDREGKGFLARGDIPRQLQITLNPGPVNFNNFNLPVSIVRQSVGRDPRAPAVPVRGPLWFRKMDLNGDGDVSRREWLGTPEDFARIDEDGDGLISVEEAERYERRRQREKEKQ